MSMSIENKSLLAKYKDKPVMNDLGIESLNESLESWNPFSKFFEKIKRAKESANQKRKEKLEYEEHVKQMQVDFVATLDKVIGKSNLTLASDVGDIQLGIFGKGKYEGLCFELYPIEEVTIEKESTKHYVVPKQSFYISDAIFGWSGSVKLLKELYESDDKGAFDDILANSDTGLNLISYNESSKYVLVFSHLIDDLDGWGGASYGSSFAVTASSINDESITKYIDKIIDAAKNKDKPKYLVRFSS